MSELVNFLESTVCEPAACIVYVMKNYTNSEAFQLFPVTEAGRKIKFIDSITGS